MSIRTRSEITAPHERRGNDGRAGRLTALLIAAAVTVGVLVGCAEGSADDAARGKARDAQRTSVVSDLQATHSIEILQPGTPPPATPTPES